MEWTPEEQELIDYFAGLDRVSISIAGYMQRELPLETVRKLLPLADIARQDKDPAGALVFYGIETPFPRVEYFADAGSIEVALLRGSSNRYILPLRPVLEVSMGRPTSKTTQ